MTIFAAEVVSWRLRRIWVIVHVLAGPRFRSTTTTRTTGVAASPSDESADIMKALLLKTDEQGRAAAARTSSHAPPPMWSGIALQAASVAGDGKGQLVSSGAVAGAHEQEKAHLKKTDDAGVIESPPPRFGGVGGATPAGASNDLSTRGQDKKRGPPQGQGDDWLGTLLGVNLLLFLLSGYRLTVLNREQRRTGGSGGAGGNAGLELT